LIERPVFLSGEKLRIPGFRQDRHRGRFPAFPAGSASIRCERENVVQAIKDGAPATEVKDDLARIVMRREELETMLARTKEEPVLLHPNMGAEYRKQVANLAQVLNREKNRGEAADILRSLVDRVQTFPPLGLENVDAHALSLSDLTLD
jgi:hypothetical protein